MSVLVIFFFFFKLHVCLFVVFLHDTLTQV